MTEYNDCDNCKYRTLYEYQEPCINCKHCYLLGTEDYVTLPDLYEPINTDNVNHPGHYTGKYECIDVMVETQGIEAVKQFCICNAFKYIFRHNKKNGNEDIKKAIWYLNKYVELEGDKND